MRIKKRPFHFFLLFILLSIGIGYLLVSFPPTFVIIWKFISIPLLPIVGILFMAAVFTLCAYLFDSYIQGILISLFSTAYLTLQYINLTNIFFILVLLALFGTLELFFLKKK